MPGTKLPESLLRSLPHPPPRAAALTMWGSLLALAFTCAGTGCAPTELGPAPPPEVAARRLATVPAALLVAGPHGSQPGQPIDDAGNVLISDAVADRLAQAGGWVRLNFRLGPHATDTPAFYAAYDQIVDRLRARGLQVLGLVSNESWRGSQADWLKNNREHGGSDGNNPLIDGFSQAFGRLARHFADGYVQDFDGGAIGPCAIFDTGFRVALGFWQSYLDGGTHAALRFPLSGEYAYGAGTRQNFQGGYLTWDPAAGVTVVVY